MSRVKNKQWRPSGHLGGARHKLVSVFWLAVMGASRLQLLWLLKDDAISGHYGYHRQVPCLCIQCVAMQTLPAALVRCSLEDVRTPSRLNGEGWESKTVWGGGGEVGGPTGGDLLLQMIYLYLFRISVPQVGVYFRAVRKSLQFLI